MGNEISKEKQYRLVAPDIDRLLCCFDRSHRNPSAPSPALVSAMEPLFTALAPLAPLKRNAEAKAIWLRIPRGTIEEYNSFDDMKESGEVETYEEYENLWHEDYPDECSWYELVLAESFHRDGTLRFRAAQLGNTTIISAMMDEDEEEYDYTEETACELCRLIIPAVQESLRLLQDGKYNDMINSTLPYQFRTGVIRRSALWQSHPAEKERALDGLSAETLAQFKNLLANGTNDEMKIGRIRYFTANDFFRACETGYRSIGYDCDEASPSRLYLRYADGRDEGLTGMGHGLNESPGNDFNDSNAWDNWFFDRTRCGGHPWEVIRGGNSTHVALYVRHDQNSLDWKFRRGEISEDAYREQQEKAGYFFEIAGKHRPFEAVSFYTALSAAGLPVILHDAEEILARFEGTDYIGIVPHHVIPKYCEEMFPEKYGQIIDFMHVYEEDMDTFGNQIEWLAEEKAELDSTFPPVPLPCQE